MPLDRGCSKAAAQANFSQLYKDGKRNPQLSAIVLSILKKACGVSSKETSMTQKEILAAGGKTEGRWVDLADLFEGLPSSPAVRGLSFNLPGGMRGAGTSPNAAPPNDTRGLAGRLGPPIPLVKCSKCGIAYNNVNGSCPKCRAKAEATNIANGMRMSPLVGASVQVACKGCGGPVRTGASCQRCGMEA